MRYLPLNQADRRSMLATIGVSSVDDLFRDVPAETLADRPFPELPNGLTEPETERSLSRLAGLNTVAGDVPFFLGAGVYRHHVPAVVDHLIQRGEFLTSYTPYQPEISQGTLRVLFEFQSQVAELTGMDVANASMWDGSTATAEAVKTAVRQTRRPRAVLSGGLHPHYRDVVLTDARLTGGEVDTPPADLAGTEDLTGALDARTACVVVQNPDVFGRVRDLTPLAEACRKAGVPLVVVVTEVVSLGLLPSPGSMGADIVVGEGQSLGNPMSFGGPHLGLFATRERLVRQMPGRLCGRAVDADGKVGYVLTLSTREQHIRREKATSNICTNSGLCAAAFSMHMTLLGGRGLADLARLNHARACQLADKLAAVPGLSVLNDAFFNEFTVRLPKPAVEVVEALAARRILAGVPVSRLFPGLDDRALLVTATETTSVEDMDGLVAGLTEVLRS